MATVVGLLAAAAVYSGIAVSAPLAAVAAEVAPVVAVVTPGEQVDLPSYGGSAVQILADTEGTVISDSSIVTAGDEGRRPMASITKVITALVILEKHPLEVGQDGPSITFDARAASYYAANIARNGSVIPLSQGQTVSLRTALTVSLMESANNWTEALADWAFGSQEEYLVAARDWLERHGFESTRMTNSVGWQGNESTTTELLLLGRLALENPVIVELTAIETLTIPGVGALENSNEILGDYGIDGTKTGSLGGRFNLLFTASIEVAGEEQRLVGVILGAPSKERLYRDVRDAVRSAEDAFVTVSIGGGDAEVAVYETAWGAESVLLSSESAQYLVWGASGALVRLEIPDAVIGEPIDGSITATLAGVEVSLPLSGGEPLAEPDLWWRLAHPFG